MIFNPFMVLPISFLIYYQVKAYSIPGTGEKAKDPIFGLAMGSGSQATGDRFR